VSTTATPGRFTTLPDEAALNATVVALEEHGFSVEVVDDLDAARQAVLARIPEGSSVMTNASVTLDQTGIADAINDGAGRWESARNKMFALAAAHDRIYQHSLPLEDARAQAAYGQHSQVGKILEIHTELPGRIHIVLIRQQVGY
jgi:LUD domain